jgi:hypothetical protein
VLALTIAAVAATGVSAHRLDEYLQAARLAIDADRVELQLDLTPGVAVAQAIIADVDRNGDGLLAPDERSAYVREVLSAIELDVDGRPLRVQPIAFHFPDLEALRTGESTIRLQSGANLPAMSDGAHRLFFRNTHRPEVSVYLANVLVPDSGRIAITAQRRHADQHDLTIDYVVHPVPRTSTSIGVAGTIAIAAVLIGLVIRRSRAGRPADTA